MSYKEVTVVEESDDAYPPPGIIMIIPSRFSSTSSFISMVLRFNNFIFFMSEMQGSHQVIHHQNHILRYHHHQFIRHQHHTLQYHHHLDFRGTSMMVVHHLNSPTNRFRKMMTQAAALF